VAFAPAALPLKTVPSSRMSIASDLVSDIYLR
jgi:hypothetical protein